MLPHTKYAIGGIGSILVVVTRVADVLCADAHGDTL